MKDELITTDPIEEIYAIRKKISARYGHDVFRLAEAIAEQQRVEEAKGRKYVRLPIARVGKPFTYPAEPDSSEVLFACESSST